MTPADPRTKPVAIHVDRQTAVTIQWADGHRSVYPVWFLQKFCGSASCSVTRQSDPTAGRGLLPIISQKALTRPEIEQVIPVGKYGLRFIYNNCNPCTGLFTFERLRAICPAENPDIQPTPLVHGLQIGQS